MNIEELVQLGSGSLVLVDEQELFIQFEDKFIEAETDAFGVKIWTDKIKKPFPVSTIPPQHLAKIAPRFPEGSYWVIIKFQDDPNGKLYMLKCTQKGLEFAFQTEFGELYVSDLPMTWLLYGKMNESNLIELQGSGEVCPIR